MSDKKRTWRVLVWAAVSSKAQATEDKVSLEAQEEQGREFAEMVGGRVVDVLRVPGHSRDIVLYEDAAREMPAYAQLREHCEQRDFDVLWARDPDRLGRDPALAQTVASLVEKAGGEVYVASAPHVLGQSSTGQRYVYAIQSVRAGEEQRRRVQHLKMGMAKRVERGLMPNAMPLGYRPVRDPLSGDTIGAEFDEAIGAVRLATQLFLEGASLHEIARQLTASPYQPPKSGREQWCASTMRKVLYNDVYAGWVSWGDHEADERSDRFPALWDEETFEAVQRERADRSGKPYRRRQGSPYLDVAFCARCGKRMVKHRNTGSAVDRLRCGTHSRQAVTGRSCHRNSIPIADVTAALVAFLDAMRDVDTLATYMASRNDGAQERQRLDQIERQVEAIAVKRRRLALAYAGGAMDVQIYQEADGELVSQVEGLQAEAKQLEGSLARTATPAQRYEVVQSLRGRLEEQVAEDPVRVATMLRRAGIRIEIEDGLVVAIGLQ